MLERFTTAARGAVTAAQDEARALHDAAIGPEHLLLGLLHAPDDPAVRVLLDSGMELAAARATAAALGEEGTGLDADALEAIGIDLETVRETVEAAFGTGALSAQRPRGRTSGSGRVRFGPGAKKALELAVRQAIGAHSRQIRAGHLLLGLLDLPDGRPLRIIRAHGLDPDALRRHVTATLSEAA